MVLRQISPFRCAPNRFINVGISSSLLSVIKAYWQSYRQHLNKKCSGKDWSKKTKDLRNRLEGKRVYRRSPSIPKTGWGLVFAGDGDARPLFDQRRGGRSNSAREDASIAYPPHTRAESGRATGEGGESASAAGEGEG